MDPKITQALVEAIQAIDRRIAAIWHDHSPAAQAELDQLDMDRRDIGIILWIDNYPLPGEEVTEDEARDALTVAATYVDLRDVDLERWVWSRDDELRRGLETLGMDNEQA